MKKRISLLLLGVLVLTGCNIVQSPSGDDSNNTQEDTLIPEMVGVFVQFEHQDKPNLPEYSDYSLPDSATYMLLPDGDAVINKSDKFFVFESFQVGYQEEGLSWFKHETRLSLTLTDYFYNTIISVNALTLDEEGEIEVHYEHGFKANSNISVNVLFTQKFKTPESNKMIIWDVTINYQKNLESVTFIEMNAGHQAINETTFLDSNVTELVTGQETAYILVEELFEGEEEPNRFILDQDYYFYEFAPKGYIPNNTRLEIVPAA